MNKVLLIDIGGTNLRYAYSDGDLSSLYETNKIQLSCIKGFNEILTNLVKDKDIDSLVISVAGPKINGSITMTNRDFSINEKDTGSSEVQIAILSERINNLTEHFKEHKHDNHSKTGLIAMVNKRKKLLKYLSNKNNQKYKEILKELNIRG